LPAAQRRAWLDLVTTWERMIISRQMYASHPKPSS